MDGRIDRLYVNYVGAEVVAGETLAVLYSPMLLSAEREYTVLIGSQPARTDALGAEHQQVLDARLVRSYGATEVFPPAIHRLAVVQVG